MEIQELMAAPLSLSLETVIDGSKFYSSDALKGKFIEAFAKSSKGSQVTAQIEKLVEKGLVLPCYKSKNLFGFIKKKLENLNLKMVLSWPKILDYEFIQLVLALHPWRFHPFLAAARLTHRQSWMRPC